MESWSGYGKISSLSEDFASNKQVLALQMFVDCRDAYNELAECGLLDIKIAKHREHRSLNANSLFHLMVGRIADALGTSKPYTKNMLITRYGQQDFLDDGTEVVIKTNIPPEVMMEQEDLHCLPVKGNDEVTFYKVFRGSHTYNTKEMSTLIDGTIEEAKELGCEVPTSKEMEAALSAWEKHHN